ncbi:hypothetical protein Aph01nite_19710 [Acrocarpospora phusangensis]|uniref:Hemopexin n=1 Tax=Acrocarpospora phusangensis TaxID=1070424 RepID=A0A919Q8W3_9ACTN|nr:hemopexin repeat-containing protein [Acrocarpospora phusangensis]GIH23661.1 hypothetical protein Aph01nite_19710 [Acrocarpospora phusangensis]
MRSDASLPSYERLFGELDFREGDEARSVYSPAAYLVDLLTLLRETFDDTSLLTRRPDLGRIPLDAKHTFELTPYLDIVNGVLETLVGDEPYERLRELRHPFALPFSLRNARLSTYLRHLDIDPVEFYRLFAARIDRDTVAREYLGLTPEDAEVVTTEAADVGEFYGLAPGETTAVLADVTRFLTATSMTGAELRELLYQDPLLERSPETFFVHQGGQVVSVAPDDRTLVTGGGEIPAAWFDRVSRFVRLSRRTGLSFTDLDLVLTSCAGDTLDLAGLRALAAAVHLHRAHDLPYDTIAALTARTLPVTVNDVPIPSGDLLAPQNRDYRRHLARSIDLAEADIAEVVQRFRDRYASPHQTSPFDRPLDVAALSLLHRVGRLVDTLGLSVGELFGVLAALEADPSIQRYTTFPLLPVIEPATQDCHRILEGTDAASSLWLAQTLVAVVAWMRTWGFGGQELTEILGEPAKPEAEEEQDAVLAGIRDRFETVGLSPGVFVSDRFDERAAAVIHDVLIAYEDGVVSPRDPRLLRFDRARAATAAYDAVADLAVLTREDFLGLGLDERLTTKIFTNLVLCGLLQADGRLTGDDVPAGLVLSSDFDELAAPLFEAMAGLEGGFYPSDLANALPELTEVEQAELYDNLLYHGYLDESGEVVDPGFFADPENVALFTAGADLDDVVDGVLATLRERMDWFREEKLPIDLGAFAELRLTETQLVTLTESLRFNGLLDADGNYQDKIALGALPVDEFGIALEFYPMRRLILDGMKGQIAARRAELSTFGPGDFAPVADDVMSQRVVDRLDGKVTTEGRVREDVRELFADPEGWLDLGAGFTEVDGTLVYQRVAAILRAQAPYRLDLAALTELGFDDEERALLVGMLIDAGHLDDALAVPEERLRYFRTITNALDFTVPGVEDYDKDIFFLLHAVATELSAGVAEVLDRLDALAAQQRRALLTVLQDVFGIAAPVVEAICTAVTPDALDLLVAPALAEDDAAADDPHFRRSYRRIRRFARLAGKLALDPVEVAVAFHDQDLAGKFPEPLALPAELDRFDALLASADGKIYVFQGAGYWTYSAATYALADPRQKPLTELSSRFAGLAGVDAAFTQTDGGEWIVGRGVDGVSRAFVRPAGGTRWQAREQVWGKVRNNFADPRRIDSAFVDVEGRTYLFSGDQYLRYSTADYAFADEGYPRAVTEWWEAEGRDVALPETFRKAVDACFQGLDGRTHLFTGERWVAVGGAEQPLTERWGKLRNTFADAARVDAAYADGEGYLLFAGNQVVRYTDSLENTGVRVADGYPKRIEAWRPDVPVEFEGAVEAAFADGSGTVHLFKDGRTVALGPTGVSAAPTAERWGVLAPVLPSGTVDAAFVGLDGKTYLFSGDRYLRYSTADYSVADLGYPRGIGGDWGGLDRVDAAFVMDGATHLFGPVGLILDLPADYEAELASGRLNPALRRRLQEHGVTVAADAPVSGASPEWQVAADGSLVLTIRRAGERLKVYGDDTPFYVRYSTRNYTVPDAGYPKPLADNWWNLPVTLADDPGFARIDAVFTGRDNQTCLFSGDRFVVFDTRHRWWSEPRTLRDRWDSIPFTKVDAAFVGKDGKTYVFSGERYVRYSTADYTQIDDRYPATVARFWGNVSNAVARTGRVDATLVTDAVELVDGVETKRTYTYLFSGDQYVRYEGHDYTTVQNGYPRAISSLSTEPRLGALTVKLDGVDAAFADRRNVYLFRGGMWHVVSDTLYRKYDDLDLAGITCAYVENGAVLVEGPGGWRRHSALEGPVGGTPVRPLRLRSVPPEFRSGLDAVLTGADGTTYLFKGPACYNTRINRDYPLAEEWGRPRNTIYQENAVDAAFVGRDGKTYLFSGDQFVTYSTNAETIDGEPKPISEHWGGLASVALAYARNGVTYLFEHADETGMMRHLVYTGDDGPYLEPDPGYPIVTDQTFWKAPDGFPAPDAVLFEGDTMLLLSGERCVQFSEATGQWSYPRPIERIWRGFGKDLEPGDALRTAFTALDGATYFFFQERYARYADRVLGPLAPIRDRWGRSLNPFVPHDGTGGIDAAIVFGDDTTFLFSGTQYVRYTGSGYRYVDPGYPKPIAANLRAEPAFANLAETFEDAVADRGAGKVVDAAVANPRTAYLVVGGALHVVSRTPVGSYEIGMLGRVRNTIVDDRKVDAALVRDQHTFLFSGDQYVRYTGTEYAYADEGYPRTIAPSLAAELGLAALPEEFEDGLDAAFRSADGQVYLFKGTRFLAGDAVRPVTEQWGRIRNEFAAGPVIDAAFVAPSGELYAFRGGQYIRYRPGVLDLVEEGYPRTIRDDWGDLPAAFEAGITGAFVLEGATYLIKDDRYVRYTGRYDVLDRTFPQAFRHRWSDKADYRLSDVHTIVRFAELARARPGLADLLGAGAADPYERLAALFGWDVDELRWVKRNAGVLTEFPLEEERFEVEFVLKLVEVFALAAKAGTGPSRLYPDVWARIWSRADLDGGADELLRLLERRHGPEDWKILAKTMHDELNLLRRDALLPAALHLHPDIENSRELYEHLLVDVEMGAVATTSRVREAIAATQLYLHRYLLDLERLTPPMGVDEEDLRQKIRTWWSWLKNYRIWEANRKVFLYPENYIRPELRDTKTPAFRELENDLLQGEITADAVLHAYKRYLDEYTEVSRLAIAGAYVYREDDADENTRRLVLFGQTRTEPRRYYYREAEFRDGERLSATWEPWLKVDIQIDAERVDPVHAFGRVFVFWTNVETIPPPATGATTIVTKQDGDKQNVSAPPPRYRVRISYSFCNLNQEWVPAQMLPPGPEVVGPITDVSLFVQASATLSGDTHDSIVISCSYTAHTPAGPVPGSTAFALTPELYAVPVAAATRPARIVELSKIFNEPVDTRTLVRFNMPVNSPDGPWFSVDHKGGSLLCRPITVAPGDDPPVQPLKGNSHRLPVWERIDAGFELPDGTRYFFDNLTQQFLVTRTKGKLRSTNESTAARWGVISNGLTSTGVVDAVLVRKEHTYVFSGREYYRYHGGRPFGAVDPGYPKPIESNDEGLPRWSRIDAAYTAANGTEYFFSHERDGYVESGALDQLRPVKDKWAVPSRSRVDAVLPRRNQLFVFFGEHYLRYSGEGRADEGYPKRLADNDDGLPRWSRMGAAFSYRNTPYYFDNNDGTYVVQGSGGLERPQSSRELGRVPTAITRTGAVDSAHLSNGHLYLTSGEEYVRYTLGADGGVPEAIDAGYPKPLAARVKAVFRRGDIRYVFGTGRYAVIGANQELGTLRADSFIDIGGNWRSLPADFLTRFTGAMDTDSDLYLFLGDHYVAASKSASVPRPYEFATLPHEVVRLTSSTAFELNRTLLTGGVAALLAPGTQEINELPAFGRDTPDPTTIVVHPWVTDVPASSHLDFQSPSGRYYWEIFFHAPLLIAQALNAAQKFEDARRWYEYIFDPTELDRYWRFLPFLAVDVRALVRACRADLDALGSRADDVAGELRPILDEVAEMAPAFDRARDFTPAEYVTLAGLAARVRPIELALNGRPELQEKVFMLGRLRRQCELMGDRDALLRAYLEDPFDPHAIAELRPVAYRRAVVMAYIDNLLDWGDLLFRQYTMESIDEARMLYIFAYDLLGRRPQGVGTRTLPPTRTYGELPGAVEDPYAERLTAGGSMLDGMGAIHGSVAGSYFYIPDNTLLEDYWTRVEDRLRKIRQSLNILGVSQPLPLFEPPVDVMALVRGAAAGLTPDQVGAGVTAPVPHYRFAFLHRKAQDLVDRVRQFGNDLLGVLERKDNEELTLLQNRQEAAIQALTRSVREAQVKVAVETLGEAEASLAAAKSRATYYEGLIAAGISATQQAQIDSMTGAAVSHFIASGLKVGSAIAYALPQVLAGPFIMGTEFGGEQAGEVLDKGAEIAESLGEGLSVLGELFGVRAEQERQEGDWKYQLMMAEADIVQLQHQVNASGHQVAIAERELEIVNQEIANQREVAAFLKDKFSNLQLYQWMSGRLSGLYFQTYDMAHEMAKSAERAYQYERGVDEAFVQPVYWEGRRNGLLAGDSLSVDLERLGKAYVDGDSRGLEITKKVSLLQLDPLAVLAFRNEGRCEFALPEALFDRDFPGHYRRRIRTLSVTFDGYEGPLGVNATLTQLGHKTVLSADPKGVKFLLDAKGAPPASVRSDWRPSQQIALSDLEEGRDNNGLFELRFDDDRYLPFEGTGAVSTWRLEAAGPVDLFDVTVTVKYTAEQGGEVFGNAVKGMLKPYPAARYFDVAGEFPDEWSRLFEDEDGALVLPLSPEMFPGMNGRQITGIHATYQLAEGGSARFLLNGDPRMALDHGKLLRTPGLGVGGPTWRLVLDGDPQALLNAGLILMYRAGAR